MIKLKHFYSRSPRHTSDLPTLYTQRSKLKNSYVLFQALNASYIDRRLPTPKHRLQLLVDTRISAPFRSRAMRSHGYGLGLDVSVSKSSWDVLTFVPTTISFCKTVRDGQWPATSAVPSGQRALIKINGPVSFSYSKRRQTEMTKLQCLQYTERKGQETGKIRKRMKKEKKDSSCFRAE